MSTDKPNEHPASWRHQLHEVIFEADTPAGKLFDVVLLVMIILSVAAVVLESIAAVRARHSTALRVAEWVFTGVFTVEYLTRLVSVRRPWRYAISFFGVVDLLAILPTYLSLILPGTQSLVAVRAMRLLRVFRVLKLARYLGEVKALVYALRATRAKIAVFLATVLTLALIMGATMYVIEGEENGFTSIPRGLYWAIVTITTVGYGDISPHTLLGQAVAAMAMILGYSLIIIPTGIFAMEMVRTTQRHISTQACPDCGREGHETDAAFCKYCGARLNPPE
jgi:voltage-gated potassium channel